MKVLSLAAVLAALSMSTAAFAKEPLGADLAAFARSKNCFACHHAEKKVIGPAFKEISRVYAQDPKASTALTEKVLKGTSGKWGPIPMPANGQLTEDEARVLVNWVLAGANGA